MRTEMTVFRRSFALLPLALVGGCATLPAYQRPAIDLPGTWANAQGAVATSVPTSRDEWWTLLGASAIDQLVAEGLRDNPTLAEAAARVDQARAALAGKSAGKTPAVSISGNATRTHNRTDPQGENTGQSNGAISATLSWEVDLWGRVHQSALAARYRLTARTADAEAARLSVIGDIADTALALRACNLTLTTLERDIVSRETELKISRARLAYGNIAPVEVATAETNLATARTDRITQEESCRRLVDALVALSGVDAATVEALLAPVQAESLTTQEKLTFLSDALPKPPAFTPALPATVLLGHPAIVAAEREVAARWSEIAVARAERLPRIDLVAILTGQWIRALGSSSSYVSNSIGAELTAPVIDGGAGGANVRAADAAYREAVAALASTVRIVIRDIEDGLAAQQSADARIETAAAALAAGRFALQANEARWRAGAIAQFELEESRRQFNQAQQSAVTAAADRARAWVALVRRTGPGVGQEQARVNGTP
jgi:multidrug efflux system outer membrane protein